MAVVIPRLAPGNGRKLIMVHVMKRVDVLVVSFESGRGKLGFENSLMGVWTRLVRPSVR